MRHIRWLIWLSQYSSLSLINSTDSTDAVFTRWLRSISISIRRLIIISVHVFDAVLFTYSLLDLHSTFLDRWTLLKLNLRCWNLLSQMTVFNHFLNSFSSVEASTHWYVSFRIHHFDRHVLNLGMCYLNSLVITFHILNVIKVIRSNISCVVVRFHFY